MDINKITKLTNEEIVALSQEQMESYCKILADDVAKREDALRQFYNTYSDTQIKAREGVNRQRKEFAAHIRKIWVDAHDKKGNSNENIEKLRVARERIAKFQGTIAAGRVHAVGLQKDGTVIHNFQGLLQVKNAVAVKSSHQSWYALKSDGTLVL